MASLSSAVVDVAPSTSAAILPLRTGEFLLAYHYQSPAIIKFDNRGRVMKVYERTGSGPGELDSPPLLFQGRGDTVIAYSDHRFLKFSPNLVHLKTHQVELSPNPLMVTLGDGRHVINHRTRTAGGWFSFAIMSAGGAAIDYKDATTVRALGGVTLLANSPSSSGFWTMHSGSSELKKWNSAGNRLLSVNIKRSWFQPWLTLTDGEPFTVRPRPQSTGIYEIDANHVLVLTKVADAKWTPVSANAGRGGRINPTALDMGNIYDTVLELVDVRTGNVLAKKVVGASLLLLHGLGIHVSAPRRLNDGHVSFDIWKVDFKELS